MRERERERERERAWSQCLIIAVFDNRSNTRWVSCLWTSRKCDAAAAAADDDDAAADDDDDDVKGQDDNGYDNVTVMLINVQLEWCYYYYYYY